LADKGLEKSQELLWPVQYFLLTLSMPLELREYYRKMQLLFYTLLLMIVAAVLQLLDNDPKNAEDADPVC
jgi:hypothetical protein